MWYLWVNAFYLETILSNNFLLLLIIENRLTVFISTDFRNIVNETINLEIIKSRKKLYEK